MALVQVLGSVDPKATESFLLMQPDVLDASVWFTEGRLHAHVTVHDDSGLSSGALRLACAEELGIHQTPADIMFVCARRRAA
ncbi:MAG: hypothetical protein QOJ65_2684 [Fimbriimonadaceae bacterium]|jgi:hypothetical protein|nr:hypothetical protein [Fimbriimonadaceae bacterium]